MSKRRISLVIAVLLVISAMPALAQEKLGDYVTEYGYDWIIGKWAASTDNGRKIELQYKWILDKHAIGVDVKMGDFEYQGMVMGVPYREEIIQVGADNMGGTWNGSWSEDYEGAVNRNQRLSPDGTKEAMDMVFIKVDNDTFKVREYPVEAGGYRATQSRGETTFKRQKADTAKASEERTELEGTWVGTPAGEYGEWTFVISKDKVEVKGPDFDYYSGTVKLNTEASPKKADFKIDKCSMPQYVGETSLAVYKLDGNKLTLATAEPGSMYRPAFFESTGGVMLFSLTKQ